MTEIQKNPHEEILSIKLRHDGVETEHTLDHYRSALETVQNKLRVSEIELERERKRANEHLEKNQNITAGIFALIEPEILAAFTSMVEESIEDIAKTGAFERAVESQIESAFDNSDFLNADDVDERIGDAIGDSSFDSAVRDAVREMINDGDITISVENIEFNVNT
jgi:hypothetical protein